MRFTLSARLLCCCSFVTPGARVADVGCDHGYLGIHLLQNAVASFVYAGDVNAGPLKSARSNANKYGVSEKIRFFLCDGVRDFPRDFDTLVCAGMGADTIISILDQAPWLQSSHYRLILQCQSKTPVLRKYLSENGFSICEEAVVQDGRFLYTVMQVCYCPEDSLTAPQYYFPPALLKTRSAQLPAYYQQTVFRLNRAIEGQKEQADPSLIQALDYLRELAQDPRFVFLKEEPYDNC